MTTSGKTDQVKGRVKQAAGVLTGDEKLEREGKLDRAAGKAKETAGKLADNVEEAASKVVEKVKSIAKR